LGVPIRVTDKVAMNTWACTHLLVCGLFLAHANRRLGWNFRYLAAQAHGTPWWKR
jgi:hypothetical protein